MYELVKEGKVTVKVAVGKISKQMGVFYNPVMKLNRDISILLLNSIDGDRLNIGLPLAGSGIRPIRFLKELNKSKIKTISINDYSNKAIKSIKNNFKLNKLKISKKVSIKNEDANLFLLNSKGFDYIDIDPFGTPNPYMDSAVKRIARDGILAVTATDTSALAGTYPKACLRKYWAKPLRNELMHEIGIRILIRKVQLIGGQYNKAMFPVFSYSKDHYVRVFFKCLKGKKEVDDVLKQHGFYQEAGPIWLGELWDRKLTSKMSKSNDVKENERFLGIIKEESKIGVVGFYDLHRIIKASKLKEIPRKLDLMGKIKKLGYLASETHFSGHGVRADCGMDNILRFMKK